MSLGMVQAVTTPVMTVLGVMGQGIRALVILIPAIRTQVNQRCSNLRKHHRPHSSNSKTVAHNSSRRGPIHSSNSTEVPRKNNSKELLHSNNSNLRPVNRYNRYNSKRNHPVNNNKTLNSSSSNRSPYNKSNPLKFSNPFPSSPSNNHPSSPKPPVKQARRVQHNRSRVIIMH